MMVERKGRAHTERAHGRKRRRVDVAEILVRELSQQRFGLPFPVFRHKDAPRQSAGAHASKEFLGRGVTEPHSEQRKALADDVVRGDQGLIAFENPSEKLRRIVVPSIAGIR
jgi:hypothetical protein